MCSKSFISSLVASRICHDLSSPIGSIGNGIELLELSNHDESIEFNLVKEACTTSIARIQFLRLVFGNATLEDYIVSRELDELIKAALGTKYEVSWSVPSKVSRVEAKKLMLSILCLATTFPLGGEIDIHFDHNRWAIRCMGEKIDANDCLWRSVLRGEVMQPPTASNIHFFLTSHKLHFFDRQIDYDVQNNSISVCF